MKKVLNFIINCTSLQLVHCNGSFFTLQYKLIIYKRCLACILLIQALPSMYFRVNLKMKKPTLCCYFTWIVFIELYFTVAFLLIRKTWEDQFAGKVGGRGVRVDTPLRTMTSNCKLKPTFRWRLHLLWSKF